jgi:hypothetical protein
MRRALIVVLGVVAILGILVPPALAQAPVPKVTIVGLFDQVTSGGKNIYDGDFARSSESEWYARTRFRPDFEFAVGRVKAVLGLEIDLQYGGCGTDGANAGCKAGANGGLDINTDIPGVIEIKWMYTEFDLTGKDSLMPFIPVLTVARVGGQPFGSLANYKPAYANGDFAGFSGVTTWAPWIKSNLAYVMIEDEVAANKTRPINTSRGEDWAAIISLAITPFKGLDIMPLYSYVKIDGTTASPAPRRTVNDASLGGGNTNATGSFRGNASHETRHTIGFDARWRFGPFSLDPTFYYQFGEQEYLRSAGGGGGSNTTDTSAWLADIIAGFQLGPVLIEARGIYSPGNKADDQLGNEKKKYYEPLDTDTGVYAGWAAIMALGVDYFNGGGNTMNQMSTNVGYDRYGRAQFGLRVTYALTPALAFYGVVSPTWTAEKVDTDTAQGNQRSAPALVGASGDDRYLGTEAMAGMTWRFSPNTAFDLQGAYLFAGAALDGCVPAAGTSGVGNPCGAGNVKKDAEDGWTMAARIRMSF